MAIWADHPFFSLDDGFTGKRECMRLGGPERTDKLCLFLLSTTHGKETYALAAAMATMRVYQDVPVIARLCRRAAFEQ